MFTMNIIETNIEGVIIIEPLYLKMNVVIFLNLLIKRNFKKSM